MCFTTHFAFLVRSYGIAIDLQICYIATKLWIYEWDNLNKSVTIICMYVFVFRVQLVINAVKRQGI